MPDYDLGTARGRIELDASSLGRASAAFATLGQGLLGFSAVTIGAFAYAAKSAADFEKVLSAVQAVSNATGREMDLLREKALQLGSSTVFGADEIARSMEQLAKAGISIEDILGGATDATVALAAAAGDELPGGVDRAAEVIANAMKTFGATADQLDHFADVLVGAAASSTISVDDLATTLTYAGPIAAALGINIDDLSAAIAILGDRGIRGSTAGTSLRGVLISLNADTGPAKKAMRELGLITEDGTNKFYDLNGSLRPLPEIMQLLQDATAGLSEQQKVSAFNAIFQRRAMNSALILAELGAAGFEDYAAAIAGIDASDVAATKLDNLSGDMILLKNATDALVKRIGFEFQDMLRGWVQGLTNVVQWLHTLDAGMLATILQGAAIAGVFTGVLGTFALVASGAIRMYRVFKELAEGIRIVIGAVRVLMLAFLTNPIVLIVAALVGLGVALYHAYQRSEAFREAWDGLFENIRPVLDAVIRGFQRFVDGFGMLIDVFRSGDDVATGFAEVLDYMFGNTGRLIPVFRGLYDAVQAIGPALVQAFQWFADNVAPAMVAGAIAIARFGQAVAEWIGDTGAPGVVSFVESIMDAVESFINWVDGTAIPAIEAFAGAIVDGFRWMQEHVFPVFTDFAELVVAVVDRVIGILQRLIDFMAPMFTGLEAIIRAGWTILVSIFTTFIETLLIIWRNFGDNLWQVIENVWNIIKVVVETALGVLRGVIQTITGLISGDWDKAWNGILKIFSSIWEGLKEVPRLAMEAIRLTIESILDAILTLWQVGWELIGTFLRTTWSVLQTIVEGAIQAFKDFIMHGVDDVVGFFLVLPLRITEALIGLATLLVDKGWDLIQGLWEGIGDNWSLVWDWLKGLPHLIAQTIGDLSDLLYDVGLAIIQGLWDGMESKLESMGNWLSSIGPSLESIVKAPLHIGSPSKVFMEIGEMTMLGLQVGMQNQLRDMYNMLRTVAPMIQSNVPTDLLSVPSASGGPGGVREISIELVFPNVTSAEEMERIQETMDQSGMLSELTRSIRVGVGGSN